MGSTPATEGIVLLMELLTYKATLCIMLQSWSCRPTLQRRSGMNNRKSKNSANNFCWALALFKDAKGRREALVRLMKSYGRFEWIRSQRYICLVSRGKLSPKEAKALSNKLEAEKLKLAKKGLNLLILEHQGMEQWCRTVLARLKKEKDDSRKFELLSLIFMLFTRSADRTRDFYGLAGKMRYSAGWSNYCPFSENPEVFRLHRIIREDSNQDVDIFAKQLLGAELGFTFDRLLAEEWGLARGYALNCLSIKCDSVPNAATWIINCISFLDCFLPACLKKDGVRIRLEIVDGNLTEGPIYDFLKERRDAWRNVGHAMRKIYKLRGELVHTMEINKDGSIAHREILDQRLNEIEKEARESAKEVMTILVPKYKEHMRNRDRVADRGVAREM